jgi:hypothetical protein
MYFKQLVKEDLGCASGQRSMIDSVLLQRHGFTAVANVVGGMDAWNKAVELERVFDEYRHFAL